MLQDQCMAANKAVLSNLWCIKVNWQAFNLAIYTEFAIKTFGATALVTVD